MFSFNFPPRGWAQCNGQLMSIAQNTALFSILGTTYGGNGTNNFGLPNLQGKTPVHWGAGIVQGETGGEQLHTLLTTEIPAHNHTLNASTGAVSGGSPTGNYLTAPSAAMYSPAGNANGVMNGQATGGGSQPHENMQPYLVVNICIALQGIFPSRN
ncbi:MAG: tail fiber protein [Actinomycetota bacterium]